MKVQPTLIVELVHIQGPFKGTIHEFAVDCISIGRHQSCSIKFPAELTSISRKHAEILREGNRYKLLDQSSNGTFINGRKVAEAYLKDGDVLEFSEGGPKVSFLSRVEEQPAAAAPINQPPADCTQSDDLPPVLDRKEALPAQLINHASTISPHHDAVSVRQQTVPETPAELRVEKVSAPVVIQFGPSIRSFRELPIVIGSGSGCDFVIQDYSLQQQHLQILFSSGEYSIRDLTGQSSVSINGKSINGHSTVHPNDLIRLSASGPLLLFLGEGRFAEAAELPEAVTEASNKGDEENLSAREQHDDNSEGLWAKLRRRF